MMDVETERKPQLELEAVIGFNGKFCWGFFRGLKVLAQTD